jgi:DNA-binding MarR family transcriptional regulator
MTADFGIRRGGRLPAEHNDRAEPDLRAAAALAQLHRAAHAVRQHVEQTVLRRESLTWNAFVIMRMVWAWERIETRQAAAEAGLAKGTLTGIVDGLAGRDLIRRQDHPDDGRLVLLELTAAGRRLMRRILPAVHAEEAETLAGLSADQVDSMAGTLRDIADRLSRATEH